MVDDALSTDNYHLEVVLGHLQVVVVAIQLDRISVSFLKVVLGHLQMTFVAI